MGLQVVACDFKYDNPYENMRDTNTRQRGDTQTEWDTGTGSAGLNFQPSDGSDTFDRSFDSIVAFDSDTDISYKMETDTPYDSESGSDTGIDTEISSDSNENYDSSSEQGTEPDCETALDTGTSIDTGTVSDSDTAPVAIELILETAEEPSGMEGEEIIFSVTVQNGAPEGVVYSLSAAPLDAVIDSASGSVNWTPAPGSIGHVGRDKEVVFTVVADQSKPLGHGRLDVQVRVHSNMDGDKFADTDDNCPLVANNVQLDLDSDNVGMLCDPLIALPEFLLGKDTDSASDLATRVYATGTRGNSVVVLAGTRDGSSSAFGDVGAAGFWASEKQTVSGNDAVFATTSELSIHMFDEQVAWLDFGNGGLMSATREKFSDVRSSPVMDVCARQFGRALAVLGEAGGDDSAILLGEVSGELESLLTDVRIVEYGCGSKAGDSAWFIVKDDTGMSLVWLDEAGEELLRESGWTEITRVEMGTGAISDDRVWFRFFSDDETTDKDRIVLTGYVNGVVDTRTRIDKASGVSDGQLVQVRGHQGENVGYIDNGKYIWFYLHNEQNILQRCSIETGNCKDILGDFTFDSVIYVWPAGDFTYVGDAYNDNTPDLAINVGAAPDGDFEMIRYADGDWKWMPGSLLVHETLRTNNDGRMGAIELTKADRVPDLVTVWMSAGTLSGYYFEMQGVTSYDISIGRTWMDNWGKFWFTISPTTDGFQSAVYSCELINSEIAAVDCIKQGNLDTYDIELLDDGVGNWLLSSNSQMVSITNGMSVNSVGVSAEPQMLFASDVLSNSPCSWFYVQEDTNRYVLLNWCDGVFTNPVIEFSTVPRFSENHKDNSFYVSGRTGTGWQLYAVNGAALAPLATNLAAEPIFISSPRERNLWVIYQTAASSLMSTLEGKKLSHQVLWTDGQISLEPRSTLPTVRVTSAAGGEAICPVGSPHGRCFDLPIPGSGTLSLASEIAYNDACMGAAVLVSKKASKTPNSSAFLWKMTDEVAPANCCESHATPLCDSAAVTACVCAIDSSCCTDNWAEQCTNTVTNRCGFCK